MAGDAVTATFQVIPGAIPAAKVTFSLDATAGYTSKNGSATAAGSQTVISNTPYPNLAASFNNVAITDEADPTKGHFDRDGDSYSAQALATAGVTPGGTVTSNGASFTWPSSAVGTNDNVAGSGVLVKVSGSGAKLAFLGAEAGFDTDSITVTYTDGTTTTGSLGFPNWCCSDPHAYGASPAITTDHRNTPSGPANFGTSYQVFYNSIPLDASKTVATVTLPAKQSIHLFAVAVQPTT